VFEGVPYKYTAIALTVCQQVCGWVYGYEEIEKRISKEWTENVAKMVLEGNAVKTDGKRGMTSQSSVGVSHCVMCAGGLIHKT
jgi:hypothetical protein